jgi:hypothetical protein
VLKIVAISRDVKDSSMNTRGISKAHKRLFLLSVLAVACVAAVAAQETSGGLKPGGEFHVYTWEDLKAFGDNIKSGKVTTISRVILKKDITCNEGEVDFVNGTKPDWSKKWTPVPLNGITFAGEGHTISGLFVDTSGVDIGMFTAVNGAAVITDLGIVNSYIAGGTHIGAIAGNLSGAAQIRNCFVNKTVVKTSGGFAGGLVGRAYDSGIIQCCYSATSVSGTTTGGLIALVSGQVLVESCFWQNNLIKYLPQGEYGRSVGDKVVTRNSAGKASSVMHSYDIMWELNKAKDESSRLWIRKDDTDYPSLSPDVKKVLLRKVIDNLDIPQSVLYTGKQIKNAELIVGTQETGPLLKSDYVLEYQDNTEPGQAGLQVKLESRNYLEGGYQVRYFTIENLGEGEVLQKVGIPYNGNPQSPQDFADKSIALLPERFGKVTATVSGNASVTNAGDYSATATVSGWGWSKNITFQYTVEKGVLLPKDFVYTLPADGFIFDGKSKTVSVQYRNGIEGTGEFVVKYDNATNAPITVGTYAVSADCVEGANYKAGNCVLGNLRIVKATLPASFKEEYLDYNLPADGVAFFNGLPQKVNVSFKPSMADGFKDVTLIVTYAYTGQTNNPSATPPIEIGGPYLVYVTVPETENHSKTTIALGSFVIARGRYDASLLQGFIPKGQKVGYNYDGTQKGAFSLREGSLPSGIGKMTPMFVNKVSGDTLYEAPSTVGVYNLFASFSEGENYDEGVVEGGELEIAKAITTWNMFEVNSPNIVPYDGQPHEIKVRLKEGYTGVGNIVVKYNGSETPPYDYGSYEVTISAEEGENYKAHPTLNFTTLNIVHVHPDSLKKWLYHDLTDREYTGNPQKIGVQWAEGIDLTKMGKITDTLYNDVKELPLETGTYKVSVKVSAGVVHPAVEIDLGSFSIRKVDLSLEANRKRFLTYPASVFFNEAPQEVKVGLKDGLAGLGSPVTITYENGLVPQDIGNYVVLVSIPEGRNFLATAFSIPFSITPKQGKIVISQADVIYTGQQIDLPALLAGTTVEDRSKVKFEYKLSTEADYGYKEERPKEVGIYTIRVTAPSEGDYSEAVTEQTFRINQAPGVLTISQDDIPYGKTLSSPQVIYTTNTEAIGTLTCRYKKEETTSQLSGGFTSVVPKEIGKYTVEATIAATQNYTFVTAEASFYIKGPVKPITVSYPATDAEYSINVGAIQIQASSAEHTLHYSSDNQAVATVDSTGLITLHGTGSVTISIRQEVNPLYEELTTPFLLSLTIKESGGSGVTDIFDTSGRVYLSSGRLIPGAVVYLEADLDESLLQGAEVAVYDLTGKMIELKKVEGRTTALHTPTKSGIYLYAFINTGKGFRRTIKAVVR